MKFYLIITREIKETTNMKAMRAQDLVFSKDKKLINDMELELGIL